MTPEVLQDSLAEEMKNIFSEDLFMTMKTPDNPSGLHSLNIYPQQLPIQKNDEDEAEPVPYMIIRIEDGTDDGEADSEYVIGVVMILGVYDGGLEAQGHRSLLHIINKVMHRFKTMPDLVSMFRQKGKIEWTIQEDGYNPYYFGAIKMDFQIPAIRREGEDDFA